MAISTLILEFILIVGIFVMLNKIHLIKLRRLNLVKNVLFNISSRTANEWKIFI